MKVAVWWPLWAAGAAALAFLLASFIGVRRARRTALTYSNVAFLEAVLGPAIPWTALFAVAWALAIVAGGAALARPSVLADVAVRDAAVVLCIDTSGSMASSDITPTRAAAAHAAAAAFITALPPGTRVAVVAFSSEAVPLGPLVGERDAALEQLDRVPPPNGATAIGSALAAAAQLLPARGRRAIVLLTDGVNNRGPDPLEIASALGERRIAIFTIGIGSQGSGELVPGTSETADLDEDALRAIARDGGGSYARAADAAALRGRLDALAGASVREPQRVDLTVPLAIGSGLLALVTAFGAALIGRFP